MIVACTNVLVYLLLPCPKTALAEILLDAQPQWAAPPLWRSEFRNVLTGYLRRGLLECSRAVELMQEAEETISAHQDMIDTELVLQLVSSSNCSSYDCEFVAAAQRLGVPLVTEDRAILAAFPEVAQSLDQATFGGSG